jgi:hypothetical protein
MIDVVREARGETIIRVDGTFDGQAAARLARRLGELNAAGKLVIDFTRVEVFHDLGVATVARELAGHVGLRVRGLARHQLRLLRYCGVEVREPALDAAGSRGDV